MATSSMVYHLNVVSHWGIVSESQTFGVLEYVRAPIMYFNSLFHIFTYNPAVYTGSFELVRWLFVAPILAGAAFGLVVLFFSVFNREIT